MKPTYRTYHILVLLFFFLSFCSFGCHRDKTPKKQSSGPDNNDIIYEISDFPINIPGNIHSFFSKTDKIYIDAVQYDLETKSITSINLYMLDSDGNNLQELSLPKTITNDTIANEFDVDDNNNIYYISSSSNANDESEQNDLVKISSSGEEIARINLETFLALPQNVSINKFCVDSIGQIGIMTESSLYLIDAQLSSFKTIKTSDASISDITVDQNGDFLCILQDTSSDTEYMISKIDVNKETLTNIQKANIPELMLVRAGSDNYSFYSVTQNGIYGYNAANDSSKFLFNFTANTVDNYELIPLKNGRFLGYLTDDEENDKFIIYSPNQLSSTSKKYLTYGTLALDPEMKSIIHNFNQSNSDISIQIKDYSSELEPLTELNKDIITGHIPDILDLRQVSIPHYIQQGILENLSPYFKEDTTISENDFLPNAIEAMKTNNNLYYFSPCFEVYSLAAKKSDVGDNTGWDYNDLYDLLNKKDQRIQLTYFNSKQELLNTFLFFEISDFIDSENGKCSFDSDEFKNILKLCNERGCDFEDNEQDESEISLLRNGSILFRECSSNPSDFKETLFAFGEDINFIGFPTKHKNGNYIYFPYPTGISSKSIYKKEAWQFLRSLMTNEYQSTSFLYEYLPTRQDSFELYMKAATSTEKYTDEFGHVITPTYRTSDIDGMTYEIKPLTQEQAQQYISLINSTNHSTYYYPDVKKIIEEETAYYFSGDKSLDDVVKIIQSRSTTYINEIQ